MNVAVSLTGFALVGGPARQDAPKAVEALKKLNVPYLVSLPLVFQTTEEWNESELGLHPVQVALQVTGFQRSLACLVCWGLPGGRGLSAPFRAWGQGGRASRDRKQAPGGSRGCACHMRP